MGWKVQGSSPCGSEVFHTCPDRPWGPPSLLYKGYQVFPGGKELPGRDADLSPPMGRTACTDPQCLYKGDLYLFLPKGNGIEVNAEKLNCLMNRMQDRIQHEGSKWILWKCGKYRWFRNGSNRSNLHEWRITSEVNSRNAFLLFSSQTFFLPVCHLKCKDSSIQNYLHV